MSGSDELISAGHDGAAAGSLAGSLVAVPGGATGLAALRPDLFALLGLTVLVSSLLWYRRLRRAIAPRPEAIVTLPRYPSVTVVRPIRGCDVDAAENFAAALDTGYVGEVETLFVFDDDADPALPIAREAIARHEADGGRGRAEVVVAGPPPIGRTGKLNAMMAGAARARGELIAFGDSDTCPDRRVLQAAVEALMSSPGAGAAFAPILVDRPPRAAGDVLYALMQNGLYAPLAALRAGATRDLPFIMGQLMVFKREAVEAIGGLQCAEGQLVDDMYLGRRLVRAGFRNVMSRHPLRITTGGMTARQFLPVYRRWLMFSRNGLPISFTWPQWLLGAAFVASLASALIALSLGRPISAIPPALAVTAIGVGLLRLQRLWGGAEVPFRFVWTAWAVFLVGLALGVGNALRRTIDWRGRTYDVGDRAALANRPRRILPAAHGRVASDLR